jgi:histidinol phosphatase-like enzyme
MPGLVLQFARQRGVDLNRSVLVGPSAADRTLAERVGTKHFENLAAMSVFVTRNS